MMDVSKSPTASSVAQLRAPRGRSLPAGHRTREISGSYAYDSGFMPSGPRLQRASSSVVSAEASPEGQGDRFPFCDPAGAE